MKGTVVPTIIAIAAAVVLSGVDASSRTANGRVRGVSKPRRALVEEETRLLRPKRSSSSGSSYSYGCLMYSSSQLQEMWTFPGSPPDCSYSYHTGDSSGGSSGGGSSGGSSGGGSSGGGSNGGGNGGGGGGDNGGDNNGGGGGGGGDNGGGDGGDNNGGGGGGDNGGGDGGGGGGGDNGDVDAEEEPDCDGAAYTSQDNGGGGDNNGNNDEVVVDNEDYANDDDNNGGDDDNNQLDPYDAFDVTECNTYSNLWLWDLSITCDSDSNLDNCECTMAEELMDMGSLSCDDLLNCPAGCSICTTCLELICGAPAARGGSSFISTSTLLYVIAGAIVALITALICCHCKRSQAQAMKKGALGTSLIEMNHKDETYEPPLPENTRGQLSSPGGTDPNDQQALLGPGGLPTFIPVTVPKSKKPDPKDDATHVSQSTAPTVAETVNSAPQDPPVIPETRNAPSTIDEADEEEDMASTSSEQQPATTDFTTDTGTSPEMLA